MITPWIPDYSAGKTAKLAIFDLDNTLLGDDSDVLWGRFLVENKLVDVTHYERENERFYEAYKAGTLDIYEFLAFALEPLARIPLDQLLSLRQRFLQEKIEPVMLAASKTLLDLHRQHGHCLLIITATNEFITRPIAERLGVHDILATKPEMAEGQYTGQVEGIPCFQEGKVERLKDWLAHHNWDFEKTWFYSDSVNDAPLLCNVDHAVAVDPDPRLQTLAEEKSWPVLSLRQPLDDISQLKLG